MDQIDLLTQEQFSGSGFLKTELQIRLYVFVCLLFQIFFLSCRHWLEEQGQCCAGEQFKFSIKQAAKIILIPSFPFIPATDELDALDCLN